MGLRAKQRSREKNTKAVLAQMSRTRWFALWPRLRGHRHLIDPLQNRPAYAAERVFVVEQARSPVRSHRERLNLEDKVPGVHILPNFSGVLCIARRQVRTFPATAVMHSTISVANSSGPVVEFQRRRQKKQPPGNTFFSA